MSPIELKLKELASKAADARDEKILAKLDNPGYQERYIAYKVSEQTLTSLTDIESTFKSIVELNPIQKSDRTNKKWSNRYIYGIGDSVRILVNILNGYRYAAAPHRELMRIELPISDSIAGQAVDSIGTFSYFNTRTTEVVLGETGNAERAKEFLEIIATELGLIIDFSSLTQTNLDKLEVRALAEAERNHKAFLAALDHSQALGIDFSM